ncbi:MBL fold metallo-hydrolase [Fodinisporobacter ferrooxydans]|uniref:MBL fold metallo-hydrolase n=1 Tax=Fodinisporobacter ferrooxydans TaxID=2901836 RepID=A0ABY4CNV1_9BACL|nr:MBL fold metallo-hydrolase [Alicyclobacillaceae bacterium MYW30-H2]
MAVQAITTREMYDRMRAGESFFILDVRNRVDYQDWRIQGQALKAINIPYFEFREDEINNQLIPKNTHVIVVSLEEESANKVAEHMQEKGYNVSYLQSGFQTWYQFYVQSNIIEQPQLKLIQVNRVAKGCLSYVIVSGKQMCVVDPAIHIQQYLEIAERENAKITHIIDTHIHTDHISGARELLKHTKAEYYIPKSEAHQTQLHCTFLNQGTIRCGSVEIRTVYVPTEGQTMGGSAALVVNNQALLSGDSIVVGEVGIPDMAGKAQEWAEKLFNTTFRRVKNLDNDVLVLPAHYADIQAINRGGYVGAFLGDLRHGAEAMAKNPSITFKKRVEGAVAALHPNYLDIVDVNRGVMDIDQVNVQELELGDL